jgi:hypothetical protein
LNAKRKIKRALVPVKINGSIFKNPQLWKLLLIVTVLLPIVPTLVFWSQSGFRALMSKAVLDKFTANAFVFPVFLVLSKEELRRFIKAVMLPFSALLMFGGPTYAILFLQKLNIPYIILVPVGFALFTAGLILFLRSIKEEVKP